MNPRHAGAYANLLILFNALGEYNKAVECGRRSLAIEPDSADVLLNLATAELGRSQREAALRWLRAKWKVKRLLCEGGGEVNAALFQAGLVDEVHLTICPLILGGRDAPTLADGAGVQHLAQAARMRLVSMKREDDNLFLIYRRAEGGSGS